MQKLGVPLPDRRSRFGIVSPPPRFGSVAAQAELHQNLTGKPSLTFSVGPFMVELFTAGHLTRSPEWSSSGVVCHQTTAPHASRVERTRSQASPDPTDGISPPSRIGLIAVGIAPETRSLINPRSGSTRFAYR